MKLSLNPFANAPKPFWVVCLISAPLALIPTFAILLSAFFIFKIFGIDPSKFAKPSSVPLTIFRFINVGIIVPILETTILAFAIRFIMLFTKKQILVASISAIFWGVIHSLKAPFWFFGTAWSFYVFSANFLIYEETSFSKGWASAFIPHGAINIFMMLVTLRA